MEANRQLITVRKQELLTKYFTSLKVSNWRGNHSFSTFAKGVCAYQCKKFLEDFTNVLNEWSLGMTTSKASKNLKTWSSFKRTVTAKSYFNKTTMFLGICKAISEVFLRYTSWTLQGQIIRATGRRLWVNFTSGSSLIPGHL